MSQMPALARPAARAPRRTVQTRPTRPALRVVQTAPTPASRLPFVLLCSVLLAAGLIAMLFLNMSLAQGAYRLHDLQRQATVLAEQEEALNADLGRLSSPTALAEKAAAIGMVPGLSPAFLRLPDGQVLGVPQVAERADATPAGGEGRAAEQRDRTRPDSAAKVDRRGPTGRTSSDAPSASRNGTQQKTTTTDRPSTR